MNEKMLTTAEMCARLRVNPRWFSRRLTRAKRVGSIADLPPLVRVGNQYRCSERDFNGWLERKKIRRTK